MTTIPRIILVGATLAALAAAAWQNDGAAASPPAAETAPPAPPPAAAPAVAPAPVARSTAPVVDESALRYFARQGDAKRLKAEIARLRLLYPDWTPPSDPLKGPIIPDPQLDRMWQLYAQGQWASLRAAIASRQATETGWQAPQDLLDRLAMGEARQRLANASDTKQYAMVTRIAADMPSELTCGDVDLLWRVAEAFARTSRTSRAQDTYRYILTTCTDAEVRIATVQKAAALLPHADLEPLLALGHAGPDGGEFRATRDDLARSSIAAAGTDPTLAIPPDALDALKRLAETGSSASDPTLLGWYFLRHGDPGRAEHWFRISRDRENTAVASQGLALALIALKRPGEAEAAAYPWRDASEEARKTYLAATANVVGQQPPAAIATDVLDRIVVAATRAHDAMTAQQLGWYSRALGQEATAARWFATALAWKPDDEPSAYGLALADGRLGRRDAVQMLARRWGARSSRIRAAADPRAAPALQPGPARPTPAEDRTAARVPLPAAPSAAYRPNAAAPGALVLPSRVLGGPLADADARCVAGDGVLSKGWCQMQLNRPMQAATDFRDAAAAASAAKRPEAAYGLSLAYLRLGLTSNAAAASVETPQGVQRNGELDAAILSQWIATAFDAHRYVDVLVGLDARARIVPEPIDLKILRGWSFYHLGHYRSAEQVFDDVASTGYHDAVAGLVATRGALGAEP